MIGRRQGTVPVSVEGLYKRTREEEAGWFEKEHPRSVRKSVLLRMLRGWL